MRFIFIVLFLVSFGSKSLAEKFTVWYCEGRHYVINPAPDEDDPLINDWRNSPMVFKTENFKFKQTDDFIEFPLYSPEMMAGLKIEWINRDKTIGYFFRRNDIMITINDEGLYIAVIHKSMGTETTTAT